MVCQKNMETNKVKIYSKEEKEKFSKQYRDNLERISKVIKAQKKLNHSNRLKKIDTIKEDIKKMDSKLDERMKERRINQIKYHKEDAGIKGIREVAEHRKKQEEKIERCKSGDFTEEDIQLGIGASNQPLEQAKDKIKKLIERVKTLQNEIDKSNEIKRKLAIKIWGEDSPVIQTCEQLSLSDLMNELEQKEKRDLERQKEIKEQKQEEHRKEAVRKLELEAEEQKPETEEPEEEPEIPQEPIEEMNEEDYIKGNKCVCGNLKRVGSKGCKDCKKERDRIRKKLNIGSSESWKIVWKDKGANIVGTSTSFRKELERG